MLQQRILPALWIAVMMFFICFVPQMRADVNTKPDENDWVQTNGPYGGSIHTLYATPEGVLFAGTGGAGIFRSMDLGDSWTPVNTGLPDFSGDGLSASTFAQKRNMLYAGTTDGLYASIDGGDRWHHVPTLSKYVSVSGIVLIGARVYIGTLGDGVWYSDDGDSWMPINDGLEDLSVMTIETNGTDAYIGTYYDGVFQWRENRKRWERIGSLRRRVDSLVMHDGSLYAGTVGGGVFRVSIRK